MNANWDHLRFFLALAEQGTLSAAARELHVSHSTVMRRIKAYEKSLQTQLFEHSDAGYSLTFQGERLWNEVVEMKHVIERVSSEISGSDQNIAGNVVITTTDTIACRVLPGMIRTLRTRYPDLRFDIQMVNQLSDIRNREADIAIRTCREPPESLIGRKVGTLRFALCASHWYIRHTGIKAFPDNSRMHDLIVLDDSYKNTPFHRWLNEHISQQTPCTVVNNFLTAEAACRAGLGITVLPEYLLNTPAAPASFDEQQSQDTVLVSLPTDSDIDANHLWVLSHRDLRDNQRIRVVRQYLCEALSHHFSP